MTQSRKTNTGRGLGALRPGGGQRLRRPLPLTLGLVVFFCLAAAAAAALRRDLRFAAAFGEALMVEAVLLLGLAWLSYLRKDGLRLFPPKRSSAAAAESWQDRVPSPGEAPPPSQPPPGPEGPEDPRYKALAQAEAALRRRISGETESAEATSNQGGKKRPGSALPFFVSGLVLLAAAFCFQYLL